MKAQFFAFALLLVWGFAPPAQKEEHSKSLEPALRDLASGKGWSVINRQVSLQADKGQEFVRMSEGPGAGVALLDSVEFPRGVIELDLRGKNVVQKSFIGVAFHVSTDTSYECIYFRPFNFRSADSAARGHAVQYINAPSYGWKRLRTEHPGDYENRINPPPEPDSWFHSRIVVTRAEVEVFVNGADKPSLRVNRLTSAERGAIGLWVGDDSGGDFANFKISVEK